MARFSLPDGQPVHCRMAVSTQRLHSSRAYRDYLKPLNIEYTMVTNFRGRANPGTRGLGLTRSRERGEFNQLDRELMAEFVPHLQRCFALREALDTKAAQAVPLAPEPIVSDSDLLRQRFALSPVQVSLTLALFNGRSIKEAAKELSITEGSARQYLYRVFDKTGVRRQTELIRLISRILK
jgi:DNA-binding CsgD family transcriptional regulator